jgi:glutamate:GABA antiporter
LGFSVNELFPKGRFIENSGVIVTIMASFLGMELAGVHINDVLNPQRNFPKAVGLSVLILSGTLILGSLAVAVVVPKEGIHFVDGVMQTFTTFLTNFKIPFLIPLLAVLIVLGSAGGSINWLISPAKGLFQAAEYGFLPPFFLTKNQKGVPSKILITQALVVSIFCILMQLFSSLNEFYWFLMALSTGLYMIMYILMFLSALKLGRPSEGYRIPKGFRTSSCILGIFCLFLDNSYRISAAGRNFNRKSSGILFYDSSWILLHDSSSVLPLELSEKSRQYPTGKLVFRRRFIANTELNGGSCIRGRYSGHVHFALGML